MDIDLIIEDERWNNISIHTGEIIRCVCSHLKLEDVSGFSLLLADDDQIEALNSQYRGKDKPTNVLSFPCEEIDAYLGDIVLSYDTISKEAIEQNKKLEDHATHMIVHGFLHLLGYDHIIEEEAEEMEACEAKILASLNIKNPYDG